MKIDKAIFFITMAIIYFLIVAIALYTPMHSDDFSYSMVGISPGAHVSHYLHWSGRILADYVSTIILSTKNHTLIAFINSIGSALLIYNMATLPTAVSKKRNYIKTSFIAIVIFLLYWVSNPNIGQVMFWVVGSANYTWTTLTIVYFLRKAIEMRENNKNDRKNICYIFTLGVLAGITNENTCITLVMAMIAISAYYRLTDSSFGKVIISALLGSTLGAVVMISAPGNFARAASKSLEAWRDISFVGKIKTHLFTTMPDVTAHIWIAIFVFMFLSISVLISSKRENDKLLYLSLLMFVSFVFANAAMVASPGYPPRAMNGQFIFLLCSISVMMHIMTRAFYILAIPLLSVLMFLFIPTYYAMYLSYKQTYLQSFIRLDIITKAKQNGMDEVEIPSYFFLGLSKGGDKFDTYHSPYMAPYFSMKKITTTALPFNYAVISGGYDYPLGIEINNNIANGVYSYNDKFKNESVFIVEFKNKITPNDNGKTIFLTPIVNNKPAKNSLPLSIETFDIGGRHFAYTKIKSIDYNSINGIELSVIER